MHLCDLVTINYILAGVIPKYDDSSIVHQTQKALWQTEFGVYGIRLSYMQWRWYVRDMFQDNEQSGGSLILHMIYSFTYTLLSIFMREFSKTESNSIRYNKRRMSKKAFSYTIKVYTRQDNYLDLSLPRSPILNIQIDCKREKEADGHTQQDEEEGQIDTSGVDREGLAHRAVFGDWLHLVTCWMICWNLMDLRFFFGWICSLGKLFS